MYNNHDVPQCALYNEHDLPMEPLQVPVAELTDQEATDDPVEVSFAKENHLNVV